MAIALIQQVTGEGVFSASTATIDVSGLSVQPDDVVIIFFGTSRILANANFIVSGDQSGAYLELADLYRSDSHDVSLVVSAAVVGATPDSTITVTSGGRGSSNPFTYILAVYRGCDPTNPIDVLTTSATLANSDLPDPPAITPITAGTKIVVAYVAAQGSASAPWDAPSDVNNFIQAVESSSVFYSRVGMGDFDWVSGAFDPAALTGGEGTALNSWGAATIALRASGAPPPPPPPPSQIRTFNWL